MASYTAKVNSIIVYGESSAMPVPSISFSSPNIVVDGHSSIVVIPTKIFFSSPNVEIISSHKQVIFNDIGIVVLSPGTSITPGVWTVASKGGAAILVSPARLVFNDSNIQMSGYKTIVSNDTAILNISGSNKIFAGSGNIIYPSPTGMNFSAFANIVLGTGIIPAPPKLIFSTQDIILVGNVYVPSELLITFPEFELIGFCGSSLSIEIPKFSLYGELLSEKIASLIGSISKFSFKSTSGGYIDLNLPIINSLNIQASNSIIANFSGELSGFNLFISARNYKDNSILITLPSLQVSYNVFTGEVANINSSLPVPTFIATCITGGVAEIINNLPSLKATLIGNKADPISLIIELLALKLYITSGNLQERILRYTQGEIR